MQQEKTILTKGEARDMLRQYAKEWNKPELAAIADQLVTRKPMYPRAKAQRRALTPDLAVQVAAYKASNPSMSNYDIGVVFGMNGARVSEAIHNVHITNGSRGRYSKAQA